MHLQAVAEGACYVTDSSVINFIIGDPRWTHFLTLVMVSHSLSFNERVIAWEFSLAFDIPFLCRCFGSVGHPECFILLLI